MSKAYQQVFEYLVNHHEVHDPATPNDIIAATGISKPTVYRLLQKKANGASPDETVSAGIFLAPETFTVYGQRTAKTYYADATRITSKDALKDLTESVTSRIDLRTPNDYIVQPKHMTKQVLEALRHDRELLYSIIDKQPTVERLMDVIFQPGRISDEQVKSWKYNCEQYQVIREEYQLALHEGDTFDKAKLTELLENLIDCRNWFADLVNLIDVLMQDPKFGTPAMFADRKIPDIGAPIIKEGK